MQFGDGVRAALDVAGTRRSTTIETLVFDPLWPAMASLHGQLRQRAS
jgi:hypothetical protein